MLNTINEIITVLLKITKIALLGVVIYWLSTLSADNVERIVITIMQVLWVM